MVSEQRVREGVCESASTDRLARDARAFCG
jgi:hypothetical protein